jgi:hypothetical protein
LADGRYYDISVRHLAVVGRTYLDVGIQAPGQPEGIADSVFTIRLEDIRRVETLAAPSPILP